MKCCWWRLQCAGCEPEICVRCGEAGEVDCYQETWGFGEGTKGIDIENLNIYIALYLQTEILNAFQIVKQNLNTTLLFFQLLAYSESLTDQVRRHCLQNIFFCRYCRQKLCCLIFRKFGTVSLNVMHYLTVFFSQRINLDEKSFSHPFCWIYHFTALFSCPRCIPQ